MLDELWNKIIEYEIADEKTLITITNINGYNEDTLNDIIYANTGYKSIEQYEESEL